MQCCSRRALLLNDDSTISMFAERKTNEKTSQRLVLQVEMGVSFTAVVVFDALLLRRTGSSARSVCSNLSHTYANTSSTAVMSDLARHGVQTPSPIGRSCCMVVTNSSVKCATTRMSCESVKPLNSGLKKYALPNACVETNQLL